MISLILLVGCHKDVKHSPKEKIAVYLGEATSTDVPVIVKGIGELVGSLEVEVKARVSGYLMSVAFRDGQLVEQGDLLFVIDQRPYLADLQSAKAQLVEAKARYRFALDFAETYGALVGEEYVSRLDYEEGIQNVGVYEGQIESAEAAITNAELNVGFTEIRAPIKGYVSKRNFDIGNYISAESSEVLTTIRKTTPLDVQFSLPAMYATDIREGQRKHPLFIECVRPGEVDTPLTGSLYFIDNTVNSLTGMIELKGVIPNEDERGWPGEFVRAYLEIKKLENVTVVPEESIIYGQDENYVYVAKEKEDELFAHLRKVGIGIQHDGSVVIQWGLRSGEKIVTDGQGNLYPNAPIFVPKAQKVNEIKEEKEGS
ncbi:MAG: Multidrug resistance protein MdtA [Chlamydiales bacterium]|nr:Multidrug resistance protein MdtA [Chlamydiales bacterium]MCH9620372.1 Multidrug resistance protein MdtA [Chlamydiales bacterium]MCH9622982.1 Multidrug resistance protein MdtA [Chlamydiales bacterium]